MLDFPCQVLTCSCLYASVASFEMVTAQECIVFRPVQALGTCTKLNAGFFYTVAIIAIYTWLEWGTGIRKICQSIHALWGLNPESLNPNSTHKFSRLYLHVSNVIYQSSLTLMSKDQDIQKAYVPWCIDSTYKHLAVCFTSWNYLIYVLLQKLSSMRSLHVLLSLVFFLALYRNWRSKKYKSIYLGSDDLFYILCPSQFLICCCNNYKTYIG